MPARWQNSTDEGSPPCSPQMPTLSLGRVFLPRAMPISIISPTPSWSSTANGSFGSSFFSR